MPILPADLARLRNTQHASQLYLAVYRPAVALHGTAANDDAIGAASIALAGVTTPRTVYRDYLTNISGVASGADDLGATRVRSYTAGGGGTGTLAIAPCNANPGVGTHFTVMEWVPPVAMRPRQQAGDVIYEDYDIAYVDQNTDYCPLVRMGPPAVAWIDPATGQAAVYLSDTSVAYKVGAALVSRLWTLPGCLTPTSTDETATVYWDTAGQYYINLLVTDDNGRTARGFRPVFIFDPPGTGGTQPVTQFAVSDLRGSQDAGGWSCTVTVWGEAALADYPHHAQVVLFARDWFGSEEYSIAGWPATYPGRGNVVLSGWIRAGTLRRDYRKKWCEFQVDTIGPLMNNMLAPACTLRAAAGLPTHWHRFENMNANYVLLHLLSQHSTVAEICDVGLYINGNWAPIYDLTETSLLEQLTQITTLARGHVHCNAQSSLWCDRYPQWWPQADRTTDTICTLTTADLLAGEIDFGDEPEENAVGRLDFTGVYYTASNNYRTYGAYAPLNAATTGALDQVDGIFVDDQADANRLAGIFYAWKNAKYKAITLRLKGNWRVFDLSPFARVLLTVTAAEHPRGETWTAMPLWIVDVSHEYLPGAGFMTTIVCERNAGAVRGWTTTLEDPNADADVGIAVTAPPALPFIPPLSISPGGMYAVSTYDLGGGQHADFSTLVSEQVGLYIQASYDKVMVNLDADGTWEFYANGVKRLQAVRASNDWTLEVYDDTATLVETITSATLGSADLMHVEFANAITLSGYAYVRADCTPDSAAGEYAWGLSCGAE